MENKILEFDWEYFMEEDLQQLNAEKIRIFMGALLSHAAKKSLLWTYNGKPFHHTVGKEFPLMYTGQMKIIFIVTGSRISKKS